MADADQKKTRGSVQAVKSTTLELSMSTQGKSLSRMKNRRLSYGFASVPGIRPIERTSQIGIEFKRPPLIFLPTYQVEPFVRFDRDRVKNLINGLLDEHFMSHKYNAQETPTLSLRFAGEIMRRVKNMQFNRYRILCIVAIGQKRAQSYNNAISFLWDHERDNYVDVQREGKSLSRMKMRKSSFGFSSVHGIKPVERSSQIGIEFKRPPLAYLPTFQLDPIIPFNIGKVKNAINDMITTRFMDHKYHSQESPALALCLASELMRNVKGMKFNRYRILVIVTIGQKRAQSYNNAISFLWDYVRDMYVDVQKEVNTAFIQVTIFGVYLD